MPRFFAYYSIVFRDHYLDEGKPIFLRGHHTREAASKVARSSWNAYAKDGGPDPRWGYVLEGKKGVEQWADSHNLEADWVRRIITRKKPQLKLVKD